MKNHIRKKLIDTRRSLSLKEVLQNSRKIKTKLFDMKDFKLASTILFYISYNNEVYTHDMIKNQLKKQKIIVVPKVNMKSMNLILSKLENWDDLIPGAYNILEPKFKKIKEICLDSIDLIIVPGVGFDEKGHRIGHGKGFYDKLLKNSKKTTHIGLCFECQIINNVPTENHDIPVDKIVTEKRIINCNKSM